MSREPQDPPPGATKPPAPPSSYSSPSPRPIFATHWHVRPHAVHPAIWGVARPIIRDVFHEAGFDCVVTCGPEGEHRRGSLHYLGLAIDVRTALAGITEAGAEALAERIRGRLAWGLPDDVESDWDVVVKPTHIHVELQPKRPYVREPWTSTPPDKGVPV